MNRYLQIIILCFCFFFIIDNFWAKDDIIFQKKNPFLAGALSFYNPGLGQLYVGDTTKGILFWASENILLFSALFISMDIKLNLKKDFGFEFSIKKKNNLSIERKITSISLGTFFIIIHIINIIDAINSAQNYNKNIEKKYFSLINVDITYKYNTPMLVLSKEF